MGAEDDADQTCLSGYTREWHPSRAFFAPHRDELHWAVQFGRAAWFESRAAYAALRALVAAYMLAGVVYSVYAVASDGLTAYYFIYLTHWTFCLETAYFVCAAVAAAKLALGMYETGVDAPRPALVAWTWRMRSVAFPAAFVVSTIYWSLLYKGGALRLEDFWLHGMNSVAVVLDIAGSAYHLRLSHVMYAAAYLGLYTLFSAIHYASNVGDGKGHRYVYPPLQWSDAEKWHAMLICVLCAVLLGITGHVQWGLYKLRRAAAAKLCPMSAEDAAVGRSHKESVLSTML